MHIVAFPSTQKRRGEIIIRKFYTIGVAKVTLNSVSALIYWLEAAEIGIG